MTQRLIIALVGLIVGSALAAAVLVALLPGPVPASLASQQRAATVTPSTLLFDDAREVAVVLTLDTASGVHSPRSGVVTALSCGVGQTVVSGASAVSLDGAPVVSLATASPLWRDIAVGDEGPDVAALENELVRLGGAPEPDAAWGWSDVRAFDALVAVAPTDDAGTVRLASVAWLPAPEVVIDSCPVALGASVAGGEVVVAFAPRLSLARFVVPTQTAAGERELVVDDTVIAAPADGVIAERAALDALASSPAFAQRDPAQDQPTLTASSILTTPVRVTVLPPSSLFGLSGNSGCVRDESGATRVTVIASQLGRTLVVPPRGLGAVLVHPDASSPCP